MGLGRSSVICPVQAFDSIQFHLGQNEDIVRMCIIKANPASNMLDLGPQMRESSSPRKPGPCRQTDQTVWKSSRQEVVTGLWVSWKGGASSPGNSPALDTVLHSCFSLVCVHCHQMPLGIVNNPNVEVLPDAKPCVCSLSPNCSKKWMTLNLALGDI